MTCESRDIKSICKLMESVDRYLSTSGTNQKNVLYFKISHHYNISTMQSSERGTLFHSSSIQRGNVFIRNHNFYTMYST